MKKFACVIGLISAFICSYAGTLTAAEPYDSLRQVSYEPYFFENSWILLNKVTAQSTKVFVDVDSPNGMAARVIMTFQLC